MNILELKFRKQAVEYFKNCSDRELLEAIFILNDEKISVTDWSCEKCKKKYGNCDDEELTDDIFECCLKRFHMESN